MAPPRASAATAAARPAAGAARGISATKLLGQRIMVGMQGTQPDAGLLRSVREGRWAR